MVNLSRIDAQLTKLGVKKTFFSRPEIKELQHILMDNEDIIKCVTGRYHGGFALLVATELRLLLVDKKPLYLTVEDIRYDMISEVDISAQLFSANVTIYTVNKELRFMGFKQQQLRELTNYVQHRVMEIRNHHQGTAMAAAMPAAPQPLQPMPQQQTYTPVQYVQVSTPVQGVDTSQLVGSTAIQGSNTFNPNPFVKTPLRIHRRWSNWS